MLVREAMSMKLQNSNPWCVVVDDVSGGDEIVRAIEKYHGCEFDVARRLEVYNDEEESEQITYVGKETYQNDLEFLMKVKKDKDEEVYGIFDKREEMFDAEKSYSDAETNMNERVKIKKDFTFNRHRNAFNTRYMGYLYYHGCFILIDSPTNNQVDIHGVGRVKNSNCLSKEGIPYYVLSQDSCT